MKLLKRLIRYVFPHGKYVVLIFLMHILYSIFSLFSLGMVIPFLSILFEKVEKIVEKPTFSLSTEGVSNFFNYYMGAVIDHSGKMAALATVAGAMILLSFLSNLFRYLGLYFMSPIRVGLIRDLRADIYKKLIILPLAFYSREKKGDLISRFGADVQEVEWSIVSMLQMLFRDPLLIIVYLATLFLISAKLTLIAFLVLPIAGVIIAWVGKKIKRSSVRAQEILGQLTAIFEETIGGLRIIKGYNAIDHAAGKFRARNQLFFRLSTKIYRRTELGSPLVEILAIGALMVVLAFGGHFVFAESGFTGEFFIFYILIFARVIPPAKSLVTCFYNIQKGLASAQRIYKIIDGDEQILEAPNPLNISELKEKIEFQNVHFSYSNGVDVLKNLNFTLEKGKNIAIVGASGSGKSTLIDLLPRFYDLTSGRILIDGVDSKLLKISDLRELFGIVNQDVILFNDTVFNNIAFGRADATAEAVVAAARIAHAHDFIEAMENGYDTVIGDRGMKLSGGERQRLSIARAVLKNPQVLIFDEATSALDTESEFLVQQAIQQLLSNRTAIVIAHRLSTIRRADAILFLKDGAISERGTHDELMARRGDYFHFCQLQAQ